MLNKPAVGLNKLEQLGPKGLPIAAVKFWVLPQSNDRRGQAHVYKAGINSGYVKITTSLK